MHLRKSLLFLLSVIAILSFVLSCQNPTSSDDGGGGSSGSTSTAGVRFQNSTADYEFYYGLKFGNAEFFFAGSDTFAPGEVTAYKDTAPGGYTVQALDNSGNWQTIFPNTVYVGSGGKYTVVIEGNQTDGYFGTLTTDVAPSVVTTSDKGPAPLGQLQE